MATAYACGKCGATAEAYAAKCAGCGAWNTLRATGGCPPSSSGAAVVGALVAGGATVIRPAAPAPARRAIPSTSVELQEIVRIRTGWATMDRTLGGRTPGYGRKGTYLVSGEPGIGKSTLLLQHAAGILREQPGERAIYVTAEMPLDQCRSAVDRTGSQSDDLLLLETKDLDEIVAALRLERPAFAVIDSAQAIRDRATDARPGSPAQLMRCGETLKACALELGCALVFLGRVVKDQSAAGPRELEHLVDAVGHLDRVGPYVDGDGVRIPLSLATVRTFAMSKTRLGPTASTPLLMTAEGTLVDYVESKSP